MLSLKPVNWTYPPNEYGLLFHPGVLSEKVRQLDRGTEDLFFSEKRGPFLFHPRKELGFRFSKQVRSYQQEASARTGPILPLPGKPKEPEILGFNFNNIK